MKLMNTKTLTCMVFAAVITVYSGTSFAADRLSDSWKEATISTRIGLNDILDNYSIETSVTGETAQLKGQVSNEVEKDLAEEIAQNVEGIKKVENMLVVNENVEISNSDSIRGKLSDATTTAKVKSRLLWSSSVPALGINVDTKGGIVSLNGEVPMASQKDLAEKLAENTSGVKKVVNRLNVMNEKRAKLGTVDADKVGKNADEMLDVAGETISDAWIDTKVTTSLTFARHVSVDDLTVVSHGGTVTLSGFVNNKAERELAEEIAKDIKGVKAVVNQIKVL